MDSFKEVSQVLIKDNLPLPAHISNLAKCLELFEFHIFQNISKLIVCFLKFH